MSYTIERKRDFSSTKSWPKQEGELSMQRNTRKTVDLMPPIRQTASIFKQPVTVYKTQESILKTDLKHCSLKKKPKQIFWEKRLERMRACDYTGVEFQSVILPKRIKSVDLCLDNDTLLQSVATALHVTSTPVIGQNATASMSKSNAAVTFDPDQPLMQAVDITDEDIRQQEDRVFVARKKLQEFLRLQ